MGVPRRVTTDLAAFAVYAAVSFAYFGARLVPHPGRLLVGHPEQDDAEIFVWSFAWFPHAIGSLTNPFVSHAVYAPTGVDLAWVTSVPGLAVLFSPLTLLAGPSAAFNVAAVLMPALSAWAAFLLCRYATRSTPASLVGGYLYGFSSYVLAQQFAGHLNLVAAFVPPLVALVAVEAVRGELGRRALVLRLAGLVALQAYISTEVAFTLTVMLALGLLLGLVLVPASRARIAALVPPILAAYALAAAIASPLLYFAWTGAAPNVNLADFYGTDLLNLVVPTEVTGWGGQTFASLTARFPGNTAERDGYLGVPALLVVALLARRRWRDAPTRFLLAGFGVALLIALGTRLVVGGHRLVWLPWSVPAGWTGVDALPSRFALYAALAVSLMVAIWTSSTRGLVFARPYVLPVLAVAALVPPVWRADDVDHPTRSAFFTSGAYRSCIPKGETLLVFPFGRWGDSLLWQAESGFWFSMAEGTLGHNDWPSSFVSDPTISALVFSFLDPAARPSMPELLALARRRHVDRIVSIDADSPYPDREQMRAFGPVREVDGALVAPACGHPPIPPARDDSK